MKLQFVHALQPEVAHELARQIIRHPDWALVSLRSIAWSIEHDQPSAVYDKCMKQLTKHQTPNRWGVCVERKYQAAFDHCSFAMGQEFCTSHWAMAARKQRRNEQNKKKQTSKTKSTPRAP